MSGDIDLRALRKARGMTLEQVGILSGMSKSQVSRMESGKLGSPETYSRVLDALGYKAVVTVEDVRKETNLDKKYILSILKVYFMCNKVKLGIERIGLFGSFARGEAGPESDIDLIVSFEKPNLLLYSTVVSQLETVFGRRVDLISARSHLKPSFLVHLNEDVIYVS